MQLILQNTVSKQVRMIGAFIAFAFIVFPSVTGATYGTTDPFKGCAPEITKTTNAVNPKVGDTITYTIDFRNTGTGNCTGGGTKVADPLPSDVEYVSESHSDNVTSGYGSFPVYHAGTHTMYWNAATLNPGESGSVSVNVKIKEKAVCGNFSFTNKAKITASELNNFGTWITSNTVNVAVSNECPVVVPDPVCTLDASPLTITRGGSATLTWTTENAKTVSIDQNIGSQNVNGNTSVSPIATTLYTLTAVGEKSTVTCTKTITVNEPDPEPTPLTCDAFTANPTSRTEAGPVTLTWGTTNATLVSIDNGVGTVDLDGSREVIVSQNTTYTLTATRGTETKTCTVPVTIVPPTASTLKCDAFAISPNSFRNGETGTLTWATTDATNVTIDQGVGGVDLDGSRTVTVNGNTTYTLTATKGSESVTCQTSASIESSGGGGGGGSSSPRCTLKASDTTIKAGEKVTLSWKNTRTNDILLKDSRGETIADSKKDNDINEDADSIIVTPSKTTKYTLTALRGSKKKMCDIEIKVDAVNVTSTRTKDPLVAGIALSRLPYTGFDAGPVLTVVFYSLLVLWALVVAYVLVVRRSSVFGVSLGSGTKHTSTWSGATTQSSIVVPKITASSTPAPAVSQMQHIPSLLTVPRKMTHGDMASPHAPVGYEAYYENYGTRATMVEEETEIPNLPVGEPSMFMDFASTDDTELLETRAHDAHVLISTDALNFIIGQNKTTGERVELLDAIIDSAKAQYPKEDGWIVVNKERILSLLK